MLKRQARGLPNGKKSCCEVLNCTQHGSDNSLLRRRSPLEELTGCNVPLGAKHYRGILFEEGLPKSACAECFTQVTPYESTSYVNKAKDHIFSRICPKGYKAMNADANTASPLLCCMVHDFTEACNKFARASYMEGFDNNRYTCDACARQLNKSPLDFDKNDLKSCGQ